MGGVSRYEWEAGTFVLPAAEFARVRQAVQDADARRKQAAYDWAQRFCAQVPAGKRRDDRAIGVELDSFANRNRVADREVLELAAWKLRRAGGKRPTRADFDFPSNRSTEFGTWGAAIRFDRDKRTVQWDVAENNHAVEHARGSALGKALFEALGSVKWTSGTGGVLVGNDEYNRDADYAGGGANYVTQGFGPIGVQQAPGKTGDYDTPKGRVVVQLTFNRRRGVVGKAVPAGQGRVPRGVTTGGQFTGRGRREPYDW